MASGLRSALGPSSTIDPFRIGSSHARLVATLVYAEGAHVTVGSLVSRSENKSKVL